MPISDANATDDLDNTIIVIESGDGSGDRAIVNSDNRVLVDDGKGPGSGPSVPSITNDLENIDMNATSGGIARGTSITVAAGMTTIFSYNGSGQFVGFQVNLQGITTNWRIVLEVDSKTPIDMLTSDINGSTVYDFNSLAPNPRPRLGIDLIGSIFIFEVPQKSMMTFSTNVTVKVERLANPAKQFNAGLISLVKV